MFRLALAFVLGLTIVSYANAQEPPQDKRFFAMQSCDDVLKMTDLIMRKYGEQPLFRGEGMQFHASGQMYTSEMMYFVNQESGSWSLVALYNDGTACMVANGRSFEPYNGPLLQRKKDQL
jgi:hypothetical protein